MSLDGADAVCAAVEWSDSPDAGTTRSLAAAAAAPAPPDPALAPLAAAPAAAPALAAVALADNDPLSADAPRWPSSPTGARSGSGSQGAGNPPQTSSACGAIGGRCPGPGGATGEVATAREDLTGAVSTRFDSSANRPV